MAQITAETLQNLRVTFSGHFNKGLGSIDQTTSSWPRVASQVPSSAGKNIYPIMENIPNMREWIGQKVINQLAENAYEIANKDYEASVSVDRNSIEDDTLGTYALPMQQLGRSAAELPDDSIWQLLKQGFVNKSYDGQSFFDTDHPVLDGTGKEVMRANMIAGTKDAWFLVDDSKLIKPLIWQVRKAPAFTSKDNSFDAKEYIYSVEARAAAGYGLWQLAFASKAELDQDSFNTAVAMMSGLKGHHNRPLNITPKLLIVPPSQRAAALKVVKAMTLENGESNINYGAVEVHVEPRLA